jgi:hypothetical protein
VVRGVVDEHVDAAEALACGRDRRLRILRVGDVDLNDEQVIGLTERRRDGARVAPAATTLWPAASAALIGGEPVVRMSCRRPALE